METDVRRTGGRRRRQVKSRQISRDEYSEKSKKETSTAKNRKALKFIGMILFAVFIALMFLIYFAVKWGLNKWGNLTTEEMIFTLKSPLEGTGQGMVGEFIRDAAVPAVILTAAVMTFFLVFKKLKKASLIRPAMIIYLAGAIVLGGYFGAYHFWDTLDISGYLYNQSHASTFIQNNYVSPKATSLTFPQKKRNVIYIYMESMEQTYMDKASGGKHAQNLIPELTELAKSGNSFAGTDGKVNGAVALSGNTWTIGGIFGATAGLPLVKPEDSKGGFTTNGTDYYPQIETIGDILRKNGYNQTFLLGSDAKFANRDIYFNQHGKYNIYDYNYAKKNGWIPKDYRVWWGYEDEKLYSFAKKQLGTMSKQSKPFNLTMLTVDTHFPDGYVCRNCGKEFKTQYENVMRCASKQIYSFINWCKTQSWYKNTTIVISGDHPTMNSKICKGVRWPDRKVYTCYINSAVKRQNIRKRLFTTQDNFPTTLAAMGVKIKGDRLGLGTNLYSDKKTLIEQYGYQSLDASMKRKSEWMYSMMKPAKNESVESLQTSGKLPSYEISLDDYNVGDKIVTMHIKKCVIPDTYKNKPVTLSVSYREDGAYGGSMTTSGIKEGQMYFLDISKSSFIKGVQRNHPAHLKGGVYVTYNGKKYRVGYVLGNINYTSTSGTRQV